MVQSYNFSRNSSGILIPSQTSNALGKEGDKVDRPLQFYSNSDIEFSKISVDHEVQRLRGGSIFDESQDHKNQTSLMVS